MTYQNLFEAPYSKLRTALFDTNAALASSRASLRTCDDRIAQVKAQLETAMRDKDSISAKIEDLENTKDRVKKEQKGLVDRLDDELKSVWAFAKEEEENTSSTGEPLAKRVKKA